MYHTLTYRYAISSAVQIDWSTGSWKSLVGTNEEFLRTSNCWVNHLWFFMIHINTVHQNNHLTKIKNKKIDIFFWCETMFCGWPEKQKKQWNQLKSAQVCTCSSSTLLRELRGTGKNVRNFQFYSTKENGRKIVEKKIDFFPSLKLSCLNLWSNSF